MILEERIKENVSQTDGKMVNVHASMFKSIMLEDSTTFNLPKELSKDFPGNVVKGEKKSQAKIHALYNFTENKFSFLQLCSFTNNDQSLASVALPYLNAGDLLIRDMGFLVLDALEKLNKNGVYFISRKSFSTKVYDIDSGDEINLVKELRKKHFIDKFVLIGKSKKLMTRLVIMPVTSGQVAYRRRKAKHDRDKRLNHNNEYYELLGYSVFITNIPTQMCGLKNIMELYGLRWRIEIIFKSWKSCFSLEKLIPSKCKNLNRILGLIYLLLLYILLFQTVWYESYRSRIEKEMKARFSLIKIAKFFIQHFYILVILKNENKLKKQLKQQCGYDLRKDRLNMIEKHEKLAA
jgi:hypothetical protein